MKNTLFILSTMVSFVLLGAGCLPTSSTSATGGIWQTQDNGANWTQLASLPQASGVGSIAGVNVTDIEIDPSDATVYYLGTDGNGVFYSYDAGTTWQRPDATQIQSGTILDMEVDPNNVCVVYIATPNNILKTTDCMRSVVEIYKIDQADEFLMSFDIDWYNSNILWFGNKQGAVAKSENAGATWSVVNRFSDEINDLQVSKADSRIVYVATDSKGFYRSVDSGITWVEFEDDLKKLFKESDEVYGFTQTEDGTSVIMNTQYGLLISVDNGLTWNALSLITEEGEVRIWDVAFAPHNASAIYYSTASTLYSTSTGGQSWVTESLPTARTPYVLEVNPDDMTRVLAGFRTLEK